MFAPHSYPPRQVEAKGPKGPVNYAPRKAYFMDKPKMDGTTTSGEAFKGWRFAENRPSLGVETVNDGSKR